MTRSLALATLICLALPLAACSRYNRPGGDLSVRSLESGAVLAPAIRTAVYRRIDTSAADIYLSDIPESRLTDPDDDLADAAGSILHIHFFIQPSAGNTPIDDTACNASVRQVVFAPSRPESGTPDAPRQVIGVYGGGGFFYPSGSVGDDLFGGSMRGGTHRLLTFSPGFSDRLGPAAVEGRVMTIRDDAACAAIQARMSGLSRQATLRPAPAQPRTAE